MGVDDALLLACGAWGEAVLDQLAHGDAAAARVPRILRIAHGDTESGGSSPQRISLLLPSVEAFRNQLNAAPPQVLRQLAPMAWLGDVRGGLAAGRELDERYRHRLSVLASEARIRRRLAEVGKGCRDVLLIGAPGEPLPSATLLLLAAWAGSIPDTEPRPRVTLLLGLSPLGADASRDEPGAARLHAFLAELDRVRESGEGPHGPGVPWSDVLIAGRPGVPRDLLSIAAAELASWWIRGGRALRDAIGQESARPMRLRGRGAAWRAVLPATASIALEEVVQAQVLQIAGSASHQILDARPEPTRELAHHAERLAADVRVAAGAPTHEDVERARHEPTGAIDPALSSRQRLDKALQKVAEDDARARDRARGALLGGAIQRMDAKVSSGFLEQQADWMWKLVLAGRATLDDVVSTLSAASLEINSSSLTKSAKDLERISGDAVQLAERRRREGAPASTIARAHAHALRAATVASRCETAATILSEAAESIGRTIVALASVRATLAGLTRLSGQRSKSGSSPWHASVPLDHAGLRRAIFGTEAAAIPWLRDLAAEAGKDPARGLSRSPDQLVEHLRAWCSRKLLDALAQQPVGDLNGIGAWLAAFLGTVPPLVDVDLDVLPAGAPAGESFLFATAGAAPRLAAALPRASHLLDGADSARIGWLTVSPPMPFVALEGLAHTRAALRRATESGRLLPMAWEHDASESDPTRFHEPAPGDLAWRTRRALESRGLERLLPPDLSACLDARTWALARLALPALQSAPREAPALRQIAVLADWALVSDVEGLASLERGAQEIEAAREPDGSDADLVDVVRAASAISVPIKKWLESGRATEGIVHLVGASQALDAAAAAAGSGLSGFERVVLCSLLAGWRDLVAARVTALRGRSDLTARVRTRRLVVRGQATLLVEIENRGRHPALSARLELLDSPAFRVLGAGSHQTGELAPGARHVVELTIKPAGSGTLAIELALTWDDLEARGKSVRVSETLELIADIPAFRRIERNPYIAGPPVRSEAMFFGRQDVFTFIGESLAGRHQDNILILHGQRRTGKSSILYQLERRDMLPEHLPVLVDLQGMGGFDTAGLLYQLARHATRRLSKVLDSAPPLPDRAAFQAAPYDAFQEHFDHVEDSLVGPGRRLLFMIDEFDALEGRVESGHVEPEVFPFLRNLMQHRERIAFLLAGTQQLVDMRRDYWSILFSLASYRHVSCLPLEAARSLIQKPLEGEVFFDDLVVESLLRLTAGHPYYLQLACQSIVQRLNQTATLACVTPDDLAAVLPEVLAAGGGHFEHEWRTLPSDTGRAALAAMASSDDTGLAWFGTAELASILGKSATAAAPLDPATVHAALSQLAAREILEESATGGSWRIRIDLLRHWIRRHRLPHAVGASGVAS